jgi:Nucleotide modification associated domain 3
MKIILSRKGFDTKAGGVPSPILPDKTLLSFPIPTDSSSKIKYDDISANGESVGKIVEDLSNRKIKRHHFAHLDPDLNASAYPRRPNWRPLFGAGSAAHSHLKKHGVAVGDVFLFFGWFRQTEIVNGTYRFVRSAPDLHIIFGWLQIGAIVATEKDAVIPWAKYHHHFRPPLYPNDVAYVSRARLELNGSKSIKGGGVFGKYREELCFTCPDQFKRSVWRLPHWFYPENRPPLTHHSDMSRWKLRDGYALLQSVGRGQEFVLDADKYPKAIAWVRGLIESAA